MKKLIFDASTGAGRVVEMTPEEVAVTMPTNAPEPVQTPEQRIADLEAEVAQLTEILEAIT